MATANISVKYSIDQASWNKVQGQLQDFYRSPQKYFKDLTDGSAKQAIDTARKISDILTEVTNKNLSTINMTRFSQELKKAHLDLNTIKYDLEQFGTAGGATFNALASGVMGTNTQLKNTNQLLDRMAITFKNTIRYGISSSVMNTFTNAFQRAYNYSVDLNKSLNDIRIVTNKSADEMERFAVTANEAAKNLGASTLDYTNAALIYYQQGLSKSEAEARAEVTLKTANVTGQTGQEVSELLTSVWNGYKVTADEAELYVDKLAAVAAHSASNLEELSVGMSKVASAANVMGVDIDQLNAQMSTIISATRQAPESVGVALKTIYARMSDIKSGIDTETTLGNYTGKMAEMGFNVLDANNNLRDMGDVIEEIGDKWNNLTREQQVSLAQTMAGTRQYNNLLALFDNWDKYSESIETSRDAMGTLQKQQDIYMESTEAHLKTLKATWQDLYQGLFDTKEINPLIDLLKDFVQVFDNFVDSFGGGVKSIAAMGAVLSNVLNKQISQGIINFVQNKSIIQQNLDLMQGKKAIITMGGSDQENKTPEQQAELQFLNTKIEYEKQIQEIESGISNEQYTQFTNLTNEIAQLEKEATLLEQSAKARQEALISKIDQNKLSSPIPEKFDSISDKASFWQEQVEKTQVTYDLNKENLKVLESQLIKVHKIAMDEQERVKLNQELAEIFASHEDLTEQITEEEIRGWDFDKLVKEDKEKILRVVRAIQKAEEQHLETLKEISQATGEEQAALDKSDTEERKLALKSEVNNILEQGKRASDIANSVATVTSSLSTFVMTWNSVTSLFQVWNDETADFGSKITQTVLTLGMAIPSLISSMTNFAKALGITNTLLDVHNAKVLIKNTLEGTSITQEQILTSVITKENIVEAIRNKLLEEEAKKQGILVAELDAEITKRIEDTAAMKAQNVEAAKGIANGKTLLKFFTSGAGAYLAGAAVVIGLVSAAISEYNKTIDGFIKSNEKRLEESHKRLEEIQKNDELINEYHKTYEAYEVGTASKEEMEKATKNLTSVIGEEIATNTELNGSYETLNKTLSKYQNVMDNVEEKERKRAINLAKTNALIQGNKKQGSWNSEANRFTLYLSQGFTLWDETDATSRLQEIFDKSFKEAGYKTKASISSGDSAEEIVKLYDNLQKFIEQEEEAGDLGSEYYKNIKKWIDSMKESIEVLKSELKDLHDTTLKEMAQITYASIDEKQPGYEAIKARREELIEYINNLSEFDEKTAEEKEKIADKYLSEADEETAELFKRYQQINSILKDYDYLNEDGKNEIKESLMQISSDDIKIAYQMEVDETYTLKNLKNFLKTAQEETKKYNITAGTKEQIKDLKVSEDVFESYVTRLKEVRKTAGEAGKDFEELNNQTEKVAIAVINANQGIADLTKNFETNKKAIQENDSSKIEYIQSLVEIGDAIEKIVGVEVSNDFILEHFPDIESIVNGDLTAIDRLRKALAQEEFKKIEIDSSIKYDGLEDDLATIQNWIDNFNAEEIIINSDLNDAPFINALNRMAQNAQITRTQIQSLLNSIGYEPVIEMKQVEVDVGQSIEDNINGRSFYNATKSKVTIQVPVIKSAQYKGGANDYTYTPPSSGSGGGGSSKQPNKQDPIEKEKDRYHDINIVLKEIENQMNILEKEKDKLFGDKLIKNLNGQLVLLNKQIDATNEKIKIANGESAELRDKLSKSGVTFNADGTIANYAQVFESQLAYVNGIVNQYNSMGAEAQEGYKDTVDKAKSDFDKLIDDISRYDELLTDFIPGLQADIQDAIDKKIDLQVEKFDMEIELRLDMAEAQKQWNNFKKKVIDEIADDDILGNALARLNDFNIYYDESGNKSIQAQTRHLQDVLDEYNKQREKLDNIYGDNQQQALEDLKKYQETLMEGLEEVFDLEKEIHESYIKMMDEAQEKFDDHIDSYELVSEVLEHDMKLIQMTLGEDAYDKLSNYYNLQQDNYNKQVDFRRQELEFWREQMNILEENSDEWDNAKEKWEEALRNWQADVEKALENIRAKFENEINLIFDNLNNQVTAGKGLEYINEEWTLINKNADQYLDTINAVTGIQDLNQKYLDAINGTSSAAQQAKLNKIREAEIKALKEKDKLTKYDLERAEKKYQVELALLALQEAQQNKSKMRLRRDSQGNYTYQYVADDDAVSDAEGKLRSAYQDLYNFDKETYLHNLEEMYSVWEEYQEKMAAAALINDPEERAEREALIQEEYGELINSLTEQNLTIRNNLYESAFDSLDYLYREDAANYKDLTLEKKDLILQELIPAWSSGVQAMTDMFTGPGGFEAVTGDAFDNIKQKTEEYENDMKQLGDTAGTSFDNIQNGLDINIDLTKELIQDNKELIDTYDEQLSKVRDVINELDKMSKKYRDIKQSALEAVEAANLLRNQEMEQAAQDAAEAQNQPLEDNTGINIPTSSSAPAATPTTGGNTSTGGGDGVPQVGDWATYLGGGYYGDSYGGSGWGDRGPGGRVRITYLNPGAPYPIHVESSDSAYGWLRKDQLTGYDTGGYTGDWHNKDGRLALLHQKELVLNSNDTKNILDTVMIVRDIVDSLGSSIMTRLSGITAQMPNINGSIDHNQTLDQNVHIEANFPNVREASEIEQALNNLVNAASQRAMERR